ncbi:MAG: tetratricopeptide repeat protein [Candidatus Hydrogenedentota bacterium]
MNADEVKQQFQQAAALFQGQQYEQALQILEQLDNTVPNNQDIMYFKARVLGVLNRAQEASALCDRLTSLGDSRGEQLKAALNVTPPGPPPITPGQQTPAGSPPPLVPDQDTMPSSYEPPQVAAGGSSNNKKMNFIGFGLMGALLLAALIVVIVRSGGGKESEAAPPPEPATTEVASAQAGDETQDTTAEPAGEAPPGEAEEASGDEKSPTEKEPPETEAEETAAANKDEVPAEASPPEQPQSPEALMAKLEAMDPSEQVKAMAKMDTAQLAELLESQAKTGLQLMEQQASTPQEMQFVAAMRQQLENTDFVETAKMMKEMLAQATPEMLAQMGASPFGEGMPSVDVPAGDSFTSSGDLLTNDIMKGFGLENEEEDDTAETESEEPQVEPEAGGAEEQPAEAIETTGEGAAEETEGEDGTAAPEKPAETEQSSETPPETVEKAEEIAEKEEVVKPVFGNEVAKVIAFPEDESLGSVYLRRKGALERAPWERVGIAKGKVGIPPNQDVKLQMEKYHLKPLLELDPDDIQVLSLWNIKVKDQSLEPIKHLTGLKQLDIRQTRISPDGWVELQEALPECRILY